MYLFLLADSQNSLGFFCICLKSSLIETILCFQSLKLLHALSNSSILALYYAACGDFDSALKYPSWFDLEGGVLDLETEGGDLSIEENIFLSIWESL